MNQEALVTASQFWSVLDSLKRDLNADVRRNPGGEVSEGRLKITMAALQQTKQFLEASDCKEIVPDLEAASPNTNIELLLLVNRYVAILRNFRLSSLMEHPYAF